MVKFWFRSNQGIDKSIDETQAAELIGAAVGQEIKVSDSPWKWVAAVVSLLLILALATASWELKQRRSPVEGGMEYQHYISFLSIEFPPYKREFVSESVFAARVLEKAGIEIRPGQAVYSVRDGEALGSPIDLDDKPETRSVNSTPHNHR